MKCETCEDLGASPPCGCPECGRIERHTRIVLLSGKQGSGKTTLTTELLKRLNCERSAVTEIRFAGPIYEIHDFARALLKRRKIEMPDKVKVKDGPLLQWLGTEWGRKTISDDVWIRAAEGEASTFFSCLAPLAPTMTAIISDCRFKNEFDAFPQALRVRLECSKTIRQERVSMWRDNDSHPSEIDLDDYVTDDRFDMVFNSQTQTVDHIATMICAQLDKNVWLEKRRV